MDTDLKARILIESLPWLRRFQGRTIVVKLGGNAMVSPELLDSFTEDMVYLATVGIKPVVVHGGGPQISAWLERFGVKSSFSGGFRVTTPEAMEVVRMVLTGQVNRQIVNRINRLAPLGVGICGEDGGLFRARKKTGTADLGQVGEVVRVRPDPVENLLAAGNIPVVSSIAPDPDDAGLSLNLNADSAASALAIGLRAEKLVMLTNVAGVYANWPRKDSLLSRLSLFEARRLRLSEGMVPKMAAAIAAVSHGVPKAAIIDGRQPHAILLEVFTNQGFGSEIVPDELEEEIE